MSMIIGPLLFSMNLLAAKAEEEEEVQQVKGKAAVEEVKCGDIVVSSICEPVCDSIFSDAKTRGEQVEKVRKRFTGKCDEICSCICDSICDSVFLEDFGG